MLYGHGYTDRQLDETEIRAILSEGLAQADLSGKRVIVIIPDGTRSGPVHLFFRFLHELLGEEVAALDFLIALGTHQPMSEEAINRHLGITAAERHGKYANVHVFNHLWSDPDTFVTVGAISAAEIETLSNGLFSQEVPISINRLIFDYDQILICGPVFPHEVAGFSGGYKYFFPGISGQEVIDFTHWLGALITSFEIIGTKDTPVRATINRAASFIDRPTMCLCYVVKGDDAFGLYVGEPEEAWAAAVGLSSQVHILWVDKPYQHVLSVMPEMYDDIWTAAKGMYKLEPVIADGGSVTIYAPHIDEISYTHGHILDEIGYHVRDYFVKQWDKFKHYPWGVIAHSTHLRGMGTYEDGIERPRIDVILATRIPKERCEKVCLGYRDPATIDPAEWAGREDEGMLLVPHAGEMLYRLKSDRGKRS